MDQLEVQVRNVALIIFSLLLSALGTAALAEGTILSNQEEVRNHFHINPPVGDLQTSPSENDQATSDSAKSAQLSSPPSSQN